MADNTSGTSTARLDLVLVDAFARRGGEGNRAAVAVVSGGMPSAEFMADVARFLREPATVFVNRVPSAENRHAMRWFVPSGELRSCGHGSLAAAHVLFSTLSAATVEFDTSLGVVPARRRDGQIEIGMPPEPLEGWTVDPAVAQWLGAPVRDAVRSPRHGLVEVDDPSAVVAMQPDLAGLAQLPVVGLAVTARSDGRPYHFVSRWFVPRLGLEDQATGTAHCLLGPYWAGRCGATALRARQASANGADIGLTVTPDLVMLAGAAVDAGRRSVTLDEIGDNTTGG